MEYDYPIEDMLSPLPEHSVSGLLFIMIIDTVLRRCSASSLVAPIEGLVSGACGADVLRDDNTILASEPESKNVKVRLDVYDGLSHLSWIFSTLKSSRVFIDKLLTGIKFDLE